jgi:hypothetical protein
MLLLLLLAAPGAAAAAVLLQDVEATIIQHLNEHLHQHHGDLSRTANKNTTSFLLSGVMTIDNPAAQNGHLDITSTNLV